MFDGKKDSPNIEENSDQFKTMQIPFVSDDRKSQNEAFSAAPENRTEDAKTILTKIGSISPMDALKNTVRQTVQEAKNEEDIDKTKNNIEQKAEIKEDNIKNTETLPPKEEKTEQEAVNKTAKKTSSLLAKCMPYIYDEQGTNYAEEKPDYTLESVEDIIDAAEKRANEKIARMYNLRTEEIEMIGSDKPRKAEQKSEPIKLRSQETSVKQPIKIGQVPKASPKIFQTAPIPKISSILFDDFSGRRTDVSGDENIITPYKEQGGMDSAEEGHTRVMPSINPQLNKNDDLDQGSTRQINLGGDIYSSSRKTPITLSSMTEEELQIEVDEFKGEKDIKRVGNMLKRNVFTARLRLLATLFLTAMVTATHLPYVKGEVDAMVLSVVSIICFSLGTIINFNIFSGFKGAFTKNSKIELPLALAVCFMIVFFVYSIISGVYPYEPAILPLASMLAYDVCIYRKESAIFNNFKLVAGRKTKKAVTLIDDASVTSAMARSMISGEILAAGETETDEIDDFLKNSLTEKAFEGKINVFSIVSLISALIIAVAVGISGASLSAGILSFATVLCIATAPSLFIADILPFAGLSDNLYNMRAAVFSKYSAEKIEQANAVVVSSCEIFPDGCVKLFNMKPLSANPIDQTMLLAASVAKVAESPLYPMLRKIVQDEAALPECDSVKYEDNLGISGWVGNNHIMIGNRSLMQAHGVRVPALEVDRKILHRGFFPIYISCDQRACALLVVGYSVDRQIGTMLGKLSDRGVTLLVKNCDPNITEQMLCDYYALYPDLVKILDHNGVNKYESATAPCEKTSAHALRRGGIEGFLGIMVGSLKLKTSSKILYIIHLLATFVIALLFAGMSLSGGVTAIRAGICILCELVGTIIALTAYFAGK